MFALNSDEYYENSIKDLEKNLSRIVADNVSLIEKEKECTERKEDAEWLVCSLKQEKEKLTLSLNVSLKELGILRRENLLLKSNITDLEDKIKEWHLIPLCRSCNVLKDTIMKEFLLVSNHWRSIA